MELEKETTELLDLLVCPGFSVKDNCIVGVNQAASALLLTPGTDVRTLLLTGAEEYASMKTGCLYLQLSIGTQSCGAAVTPMEDLFIFVLDQDAMNEAINAYALAGQVFRDPLSNAVISANVLSSAGSDPHLSQLNRSLQQLCRMVNNMSDAALFLSVFHPEIQNVSSLIAEIFEKTGGLLEQSEKKLLYTGLTQDVYASVDIQQLERGILNLLSNAVKFSTPGSPIEAKLTQRGQFLVLRITDRGSQIPDGILNQIFRRYLRSPGIEDGRFGLGLGLVLSRAAAVNHGGTLLIDQPSPGCTRVTMTIALRQSGETMLRSPIYRVDYAGGQDHALMELSDSLDASFYGKKK